jgi:hypothetical protein
VSDINQLLDRQTLWQRTRQALTWPEKVRMAEQMRESILQLRRSGQGEATSARTAPTESHSPRPKRP